MKKIAFLGIMLFIISSQIFADENASFIWQLDNNQENNQKINFINLNPMFFNDYFLLRISRNISLNTYYQPNRNIQTISQNDPDFDLLTSILYNGTIITSWFINYPNNYPAGSNQSDIWRQQREIENIYRGISPYPIKNFYQGYPYY
jgi:hypothetical protein